MHLWAANRNESSHSSTWMGLQTGVGIDVIYKTIQHVHISHLCCLANQGFRAIEEKGRPYQVDVPSTMALTKHH